MFACKVRSHVYVTAMPGKAPGKVPVHYFGTQEFAWMRSSDVVSFGAGLQNGMHVCKPSNRSKAAFLRALHEVSVYFLVRKDTWSAVLILHLPFVAYDGDNKGVVFALMS